MGKNCASCGTECEHRDQEGGATEVLPPQCRRRQKLCRPVAPNTKRARRDGPTEGGDLPEAEEGSRREKETSVP